MGPSSAGRSISTAPLPSLPIPMMPNSCAFANWLAPRLQTAVAISNLRSLKRDGGNISVASLVILQHALRFNVKRN